MGTFTIIHSELGSDTFVCEARKLNEEEKQEFAEWFREKGAICVGDRIELPHIEWDELPDVADHKTHGLIASSVNAIEISNEEKEYFINLNEQRQKEKEIKEMTERKAYEEKLLKAKEEKEVMLRDVKWDIAEKTAYDEGGKTIVCYHTIVINENTYKFTERNVFDFGRVINPKGGGLISKIDDRWFIESYDKEHGWVQGRTIDGDELRAYLIVQKYGKYACSMVRM